MSSACSECGFDLEQLSIDDAADLIGALGPQYRAAFAVAGGDHELGPPDPDAIALNESYNDADPGLVLDSLEQQTTRFATRARGHHLHDVQRLLA
jgi:hypothetical protein